MRETRVSPITLIRIKSSKT